ncbi:transcription factor S [Candidatus Pacearchaeota archaeon CG06_land_8_20_14_3_00_35_12]|nr:MAG: transcription factor S [Candidatus Pacearchaeota archaeon CG06_land_8_20_14_3_00_35_12]
MDFCPKCGSILVKKRERFSCPKCSYVSKDKLKITSSEKMAEKQHVGVVHPEKETSVWPIVIAICPKCGNDKAYHWSTQMRAADEAETRFFRCTKCKYTWREYN